MSLKLKIARQEAAGDGRPAVRGGARGERRLPQPGLRRLPVAAARRQRRAALAHARAAPVRVLLLRVAMSVLGQKFSCTLCQHRCDWN